MPLSAPAARKHIHTREITCQGYLREDGLWDIEGHVKDVKTYAFHNEWRGHMEPGDPIHDMWIRLTVDNDFRVHAVETTMDGTPYAICGGVRPNFQRLVGERIKGGWRRRVKELLGGPQGCTHLVELLGPVGTVAFQTIRPYLRYLAKQQLEEGDEDTTTRRPWQIDTCYGWAADNEVVRRYLPEHYTGPASPAAAPGEPHGAAAADAAAESPES
ncbi:MAG TPA: DUF2889 domain-containing protein [bacterium]|nr:DUF2889 domain-containing protein [bacterium]